MSRFFFVEPWEDEVLLLILKARIASNPESVLLTEPKGSDFIILEREEDRQKLSKGFRGRGVTLAVIEMLRNSLKNSP